MGNGMVKFKIMPGENEQIDAVIKVPDETRSVFHGVVIDECNKPIHNAVVKLLIIDGNNKHLEPITHTFTDENGEFLLGPLCAHVKYVIKIWNNNVKIRKIVIKPEECEEDCLNGQSHEEKTICENESELNIESLVEANNKSPLNNNILSVKQPNINRYSNGNAKVQSKTTMNNKNRFMK